MEREIARDLPKLAARVEAAIAEVKQADVTALEARRAFDRAVSAKAEAAYRLTGGIDRLNAQLRETTSPSITAFLSEMHHEWDRALRGFSFAHEHETSPVTGFHRSISRHNTQSVQARVAAIRSAIQAAEDMALSEPDQSVVRRSPRRTAQRQGRRSFRRRRAGDPEHGAGRRAAATVPGAESQSWGSFPGWQALPFWVGWQRV
jgi:hypothetical protein